MWRPVAGAEGREEGTGRRRRRAGCPSSSAAAHCKFQRAWTRRIDRLELLTGVGLFEIVLQVGEPLAPSRKAATASLRRIRQLDLVGQLEHEVRGQRHLVPHLLFALGL